jgi:hypothetical protein
MLKNPVAEQKRQERRKNVFKTWGGGKGCHMVSVADSNEY